MDGRRIILDCLQRVRHSAHWLMLALTLVLFGFVALLVDLKPHVDENFFFSTSDPQFQESKKIEERFPAGSQLILSVSSSNISSGPYLERLAQLTDRIKSIDSVTGVRSEERRVGKEWRVMW